MQCFGFGGFGVTRGLTQGDEDCFSNLIGERSAFVLDFAAALGISKFVENTAFSLKKKHGKLGFT